jgi:hypothetical protein
MFQEKSMMQPSRKPAQLRLPVREQERELMGLGAYRHWSFEVVGVAPVPEAPVFHRDWWLVPLAQDHSPIPAFALERVQAIYEAGIRPKAFVVAHEARALLPAPANMPRISPLEFWGRQLAEHSATAVRVLGAVLSVVIPAAVAILGTAVLVGLETAIAIDPCLIAVTEDGVWIRVASWME